MNLLKYLRYIFVVIYILSGLPAPLFSQELNLVSEQAFGTYAMNNLKEFNTLKLNSLPFEAGITDNFPAYWNSKILLQYSMKKFLTLGFTYSNQSTGSRISRVDYSGEYFFNTKIKASSYGLMADYNVNFNKLRFSFGNEVGIELSKLGLNEYLEINFESAENSYSFKSKNLYYEPTIKLSYPILFFRLGIVTGYVLDLKKGIFLNSGSDKYELTLSDGKKVTSDWSGARLGISLSVNFLQIFKTTGQNENSHSIVINSH